MHKRIHKHRHKLKRALHVSLLLAGVMVVMSGMGVGAQDVTQGYHTDEELQNGMLVRIKPDNKANVEALTQEKETDMFGVVVSSTQAPVSLTDPEAAKQVYVATIGQYDVLVSTQNGVIRTGDPIVVSSLKGVGMKSDEFHRIIIGKALESFGDNSDAESRVELEGSGTVALGRIRVDISVKRNPIYSGDTIAGVPHQLSRLAYAVTDKPVTALRIYACLAVIAMCILIAGAILYSGIHSGMTSIGRNPLAKRSILRNLVIMILTSMSVVLLGLVAVYLILKV